MQSLNDHFRELILAIDKARRGKIAHSYLTDEQRSLSPKEAAKMVRYLVPEAISPATPGL